MKGLTFDKIGFKIDGEDTFFVSGEFHYFRVPREDWKRRMELFIEAGGNCLATYVPWVIHEPEEGDIRFGDTDFRDLIGFLETAKEVGLKVLLRPGPYQYSELSNAGIPTWLLEKYPEILAVDIEGKPIRGYAASYIHPTFLEKARVYYRAFAEQVRPYMVENGGPVYLLQVDNELAGIHLWSFSMDYNPDSMGFGQPDGRYPTWLRNKYGTIDKLNAAYGTRFQRFELVQPIAKADKSDKGACRRLKDYSAFYRSTMAEYLTTLAGWLREDGLGGVICHNSGTPTMNCLFPDTVKAFEGENFLLSSDHYYTLNQSWEQNNPTPQYALKVLMGNDTLRAMGMPPVAMELPGGSCSDTPPILANDMKACYLTNVAMGLKGMNYYIFTGGPNVPGTGESCDLYDFGAPVAADGTIREDKFNAMKSVGQFMKDHSWMQRGRRVASVQIGFEWNSQQCDDFDYNATLGGAAVNNFIKCGLLYTLMCSRYSGEMVLLTGELDLSRPLIVPCPSAMSVEAQGAVIDFVKRGGRVMLLPTLPELDLEYNPAQQLRELLGEAEFMGRSKFAGPMTVEGVGRVFGVRPLTTCTKLPEGARVIATDANNDKVAGFIMPCGKGQILWFGGMWQMSTFPQAAMLEHLVELLSGDACVESSNRNIFTSLWTDEAGHRTVFVMNLYSSPQTTDITVHYGGEVKLGQLNLEAMEVRTVDI